jgi:hypothetical protein
MRKLFVSILLMVFAFATPSPAQRHIADFGIGYSLLHDGDASVTGHGFNAAIAGHFNEWFGLEGEVGMNFDSLQLLSTDVDVTMTSFAGGPRVSMDLPMATPFVHFLLGGMNADAGALGSSVSETVFIIQPGGGIDVWLSDRMGLRFTGDYRRWFDEGEAGNEVRFTAGIVFGF